MIKTIRDMPRIQSVLDVCKELQMGCVGQADIEAGMTLQQYKQACENSKLITIYGTTGQCWQFCKRVEKLVLDVKALEVCLYA